MVPKTHSTRTLFLNREESWLKFNWRVLEEAEDTNNPLLERVKFLAITASNLDEFFEIRVGGLLQQLEDGQNSISSGGLTMVEERELINRATHKFVDEQYSCWNDRLRPALAEQAFACSVSTNSMKRPRPSSKNIASANSIRCSRP